MEQIGHMWDTQPNFTSQELQTIRVPTTIADGQYEEGILRSHTEYMAHTIPGAKLVIIPKVSHFAILQNPKALSSEILKCLNRP